jgi:hypothetical protein
MTGQRYTVSAALAAIASATALCLPAAANADPIGPCAEVPFVGVCVPPSQQPTPPRQQSLGETAFAPDASGAGVYTVN